MKNTIIILLVLLPALAKAQSDSVQDLIYDLRRTDGVTSIHINGTLIKIARVLAEFADEDDEDVEAFTKASKRLKGVDIINISRKSRFDSDDLEDLVANMENEGYTELMKVREKGKDFTVYSLNEDEESLDDVVIIADERSEISIIALEGEIMLQELYVMLD